MLCQPRDGAPLITEMLLGAPHPAGMFTRSIFPTLAYWTHTLNISRLPMWVVSCGEKGQRTAHVTLTSESPSSRTAPWIFLHGGTGPLWHQDPTRLSSVFTTGSDWTACKAVSMLRRSTFSIAGMCNFRPLQMDGEARPGFRSQTASSVAATSLQWEGLLGSGSLPLLGCPCPRESSFQEPTWRLW